MGVALCFEPSLLWNNVCVGVAVETHVRGGRRLRYRRATERIAYFVFSVQTLYLQLFSVSERVSRLGNTTDPGNTVFCVYYKTSVLLVVFVQVSYLLCDRIRAGHALIWTCIASVRKLLSHWSSYSGSKWVERTQNHFACSLRCSRRKLQLFATAILSFSCPTCSNTDSSRPSAGLHATFLSADDLASHRCLRGTSLCV